MDAALNALDLEQMAEGLGAHFYRPKWEQSLLAQDLNPGDLEPWEDTMGRLGLFPQDMVALCKAGVPRYWFLDATGAVASVKLHPEELAQWLAWKVLENQRAASC